MKYKRGIEQRYRKPQKKKIQTEILEIKSPFSKNKTKMDNHTNRLEQVEDRISELKDK
jgi:hypothetical protein